MAFGLLDSLRGLDGKVNFWIIPQIYNGPHYSNGYINGLSYATNPNSDYEVSRGYALPWNDSDSALTYANEIITQDSISYNNGRNAILINYGGSNVISQEIAFKNGTRFVFQQATPQLRVYDSNNNLVQSYNYIIYNTRYSHGLYICIDMDLREAFVSSFYWNPNFQHGGSNQQSGYFRPRETASQSSRRLLYDALSGNMIYPDPYSYGGYSYSTEGEHGDYSEVSDVIAEPTTPASLAVASGFVTVYNPSYTQIVNLGNYMWNSLPLDTLRKLVANPLDCVIGLSIFPMMIPDDGRQWEIMIGNVNSHIVAKKALSQFVTLDCGKLFIKPYSKTYLDYSPYTKIELTLPYVGSKMLDTDVVMGKWLHLVYKIDLISGVCLASLSVCEEENGSYSVVGEYVGKCNIEIPIVSSDFRNIESGLIGAVTGLGALMVTGGAYGASTMGTGLADIVNGMKPHIEKSGSLHSCIGLLGVQKPRIIKTIPRQCVPETQQTMQGYPSYISSFVSDLEGFTMFEDIKIESEAMTENEKKRARDLLIGGVWL